MSAIQPSYLTSSQNGIHGGSSSSPFSRLSKLLVIAFSIFGGRGSSGEAISLDSTGTQLQDKSFCAINDALNAPSPFDILNDKCYQLVNNDHHEMMASENFFTESHLDGYRTLYHCTKEANGKKISKRGTFAEKTASHDLRSEAILEDYFQQFPQQKMIGIMGGSNLDRDTQGYKDVALIAKKLAELGFIIITGGGPGAMEAAHLGARFAFLSTEHLDEAIAILSTVPKYVEGDWLRTAQEVMELYPRVVEGHDVAIPTFVYGQRPPTPFASNFVTFFKESTREEAILLSATGGIIFTPGSEGTDEEVMSSIKHKAYRGPVYSQRPLILYNPEHWEEKFTATITKKAYLAGSLEEVFQHIKI